MARETYIDKLPIDTDTDSEVKELLSVLDLINLAKVNVEYGRKAVPPHHQRIAARLQLIKEELILLSVIVEHEAGLIGGSDSVPDTDPAPEEEATQVNLEPPKPIPIPDPPELTDE